MLPPPILQTATLLSDASGNWGTGANWDRDWFYLFSNQHIPGYPYLHKGAVLAMAVWGKVGQGHTIQV